MTTKENNPKDALGTAKACLSWLPIEVLFEVAVAMAEGGYKYGGHNYLVAAPRATVYLDAAERHMFQWSRLHEEADAESGASLHHISKAIASLVVLRAAMISKNYVDDRAPRIPVDFLDELNAKMKQLAANSPDPVARYLDGGKRGPGRILEPA